MELETLKSEIQDMIKDCSVATAQAEEVDEYKTADIYKGWIEALEYVIGLLDKPEPKVILGDPRTNEIITLEDREYATIDLISDEFLYNTYPKSANGVFARCDVVGVEYNNDDDMMFSVCVKYGRQDDCYNEVFTDNIHVTRKDLKNAVKNNTTPKYTENEH